VKKDGENNLKVGKIGQTINQTSALGKKHDKILSMMGFKHLLKEHVGKCTMV